MSLSPDLNTPHAAQRPEAGTVVDLTKYIPGNAFPLENPQTDIPRIAGDARLTQEIEAAVQKIPRFHSLSLGDARCMSELPPASVHLVLTSPPYWTLKEYRHSEGKMGHIDDYDEFLSELDKVWTHCFRALVPSDLRGR
jgi:modification methylase